MEIMFIILIVIIIGSASRIDSTLKKILAELRNNREEEALQRAKDLKRQTKVD